MPTAVIVSSPAGIEDESGAIIADDEGMADVKTLALNVRRLLHILRVLIAHLAAHLAARHLARWPRLLGRAKLARLSGPVRLRRLFEDAGGGFVKFGQILALQSDLLPLEVLQRALQPARPPRAVSLRGRRAGRPQRARADAGGDLRPLRGRAVVRRLDRAGARRGAGRPAGRRQGPAPVGRRRVRRGRPPGPARHGPHPAPPVEEVLLGARAHGRLHRVDARGARLPARGEVRGAAAAQRRRQPVRAGAGDLLGSRRRAGCSSWSSSRA